MKLFHTHKWKPVETKYPIMVAWRYDYNDGTAVYWKCDCGAEKVTEHVFQWVIWKNTIVHVIEDKT